MYTAREKSRVTSISMRRTVDGQIPKYAIKKVAALWRRGERAATRKNDRIHHARIDLKDLIISIKREKRLCPSGGRVWHIDCEIPFDTGTAPRPCNYTGVGRRVDGRHYINYVLPSLRRRGKSTVSSCRGDGVSSPRVARVSTLEVVIGLVTQDHRKRKKLLKLQQFCAERYVIIQEQKWFDCNGANTVAMQNDKKLVVYI